jgi:hypothetical protein
MAKHLKENVLHGRDHDEDHASDNRWRHQESSSFARHAALSSAPKKVREADSHNNVSGLADFLNKSRIEPLGAGAAAGTHKPIMIDRSRAEGGGVVAQSAAGVSMDGDAGVTDILKTDGREVRCGPLINYRRIEGSMWFGSVLIVTKGGPQEGDFEPELKLRRVERVSNGANGLGNALPSDNIKEPDGASSSRGPRDEWPITTESGANIKDSDTKVKAVKLYADLDNVFWRFHIQVEMQEAETHWHYEIPGLRFPPKSKKTDKQSFFVPALNQSMRVMFHSCNGFSVGTDEAAWSGPALWNDVVRVHKETPFHVMIGGGDQIYNDGIRVHGPLKAWSAIPNPKKRRDYKFPEALRKDCDDYYVMNYIKWYSTEPFATANGQIPQLNLWDDHDIIDGFGSYVSDFMKCDVFRGIGGTAYKYYMLFQHHLPPPVSTYTTDAPQTMEAGENGVGADPEQMKDTFVLQGQEEEPCYIIGPQPGPYVAEHSRSIYARLGARMAFFGIDARTERTRHQVNYPETYAIIFDRLRKELAAAAVSSNPIQHLIVLLGIPIAYPRLTWLENVLQSPLIGPIKFLNKRFGVAGGFFNHFDGSVDLLDDLDDHYTARTHKKERLGLVLKLQNLAAEFSVRISILGGDVHLAACGRFYSNPKLGIPVINDNRYIANIISSAIVNKPPPSAIANLLARRNKLHHLDESTDETLLNLFDKKSGHEAKTASSNHVTMPARNWAMITENPLTSSNGGGQHMENRHDLDNGPTLDVDSHANGTNGKSNNHSRNHSPAMSPDECTGRDGHHPLHPGEVNAGSRSRAVISHGKSGDGSLDVCIRVEKDQRDPQGHTQSYGFWIPPLKYTGAGQMDMRKRDNIIGAVSAHM